HRPDVFITSTDAANVPDGGIRCLARAHQRWPELKSVVLAPDYDAQQIEAAFAAGASGFCIKRAAVDDLAVPVPQGLDHSIFLATAHELQGPVRVQASSQSREESINVLTRREVEILRLVAEGHSNSALAKMLWVTEQTVKFHLANIYRKLDVANRTEASRWAHLHGVLNPVPGTAGNARGTGIRGGGDAGASAPRGESRRTGEENAAQASPRPPGKGRATRTFGARTSEVGPTTAAHPNTSRSES